MGTKIEKFRREFRSEFQRLTSGLSAYFASGQNAPSSIAASPTNHGEADEVERRNEENARTELARKIPK